jgi:Sulfotransferase domain
VEVPIIVSERLPNLLVAGVPKAGTGSLFSYLGQHPEICPATIKEVGYFAPLIAGAEALASLDSYRSYFTHCGMQRYRLEATPSYCFGGERVCRAIKETLDNPRILIILRDPTERLWSAYTFQRSLGNLAHIKTFEDYLSACQEQRRRGHEFIVRGHLNGLSIGFYSNYLPEWFETFGDDLRIVFTDELSEAPAEVVAATCRWLNIDDRIAASFEYASVNKTAHPRSVLFSRAAFAVKEKTDRWLRRLPRVRGVFSSVYYRLNTGALTERLGTTTKQRIDELYSASNNHVAEILRARGYQSLPRWLSGVDAEDSVSPPRRREGVNSAKMGRAR